MLKSPNLCLEDETCLPLTSDRSRAMHFNFPPKKGTGISRLIPSCPAPALSLLYQMLAYDPDERITAGTALRHTYFREMRCAKKEQFTTFELLSRFCMTKVQALSFTNNLNFFFFQDGREESRDSSQTYRDSGGNRQ